MLFFGEPNSLLFTCLLRMTEKTIMGFQVSCRSAH
jgi:hypothetical protein